MAVEYTDKQLVNRTIQILNDYQRLYPDGNKDNILYESLQYHKYLCEKRGLKFNK